MQNENDSDNLDKYHQNGVHLSRMSHIQEDAEDIKRKQGENYRTDHTDDDCLKIPCYVFRASLFSEANPNPNVKARTKAVITFINGGMETEK